MGSSDSTKVRYIGCRKQQFAVTIKTVPFGSHVSTVLLVHAYCVVLISLACGNL